VADTIDPLGGSWFVEGLTDRMEQQAEELFSRIDAMGSGSMLDGVLNGISEGWFQSALSDSAYEFEKAVSSGDRVIVGVNKHVNPDERPLEILRVPAEVESGMRRKLADLRRDRDEEAATSALKAVTEAAKGDANLMPLLIDAARAKATLGEIVQSLQEVFGGYRECSVV